MAFSMPVFIEQRSNMNTIGDKNFKRVLLKPTPEDLPNQIELLSDRAETRSSEQKKKTILPNCIVQSDYNIRLETINEAEIEDSFRK